MSCCPSHPGPHLPLPSAATGHHHLQTLSPSSSTPPVGPQAQWPLVPSRACGGQRGTRGSPGAAQTLGGGCTELFSAPLLPSCCGMRDAANPLHARWQDPAPGPPHSDHAGTWLSTALYCYRLELLACLRSVGGSVRASQSCPAAGVLDPSRGGWSWGRSPGGWERLPGAPARWGCLGASSTR